jgi:hypothetical protein
MKHELFYLYIRSAVKIAMQLSERRQNLLPAANHVRRLLIMEVLSVLLETNVLNYIIRHVGWIVVVARAVF